MIHPKTHRQLFGSRTKIWTQAVQCAESTSDHCKMLQLTLRQPTNASQGCLSNQRCQHIYLWPNDVRVLQCVTIVFNICRGGPLVAHLPLILYPCPGQWLFLGVLHHNGLVLHSCFQSLFTSGTFSNSTLNSISITWASGTIMPFWVSSLQLMQSYDTSLMPTRSLITK